MVKILLEHSGVKVIKTGILFYSDCPDERDINQDFIESDIKGFGDALKILYKRFARFSLISEYVFACPQAKNQKLQQSAKDVGVKVHEFSLDSTNKKPRFLSRYHWGMESDSGSESWIGSVFFDVIEKFGWDKLILIPVGNLLVEPTAVIDGLILHNREKFDASFSEERVAGANWAVLEGDLLRALQKNHEDIMSVHGGLYWALRKPLYPFKIGAFHCPRVRPVLDVDLSLKSARAVSVFNNSDCADFDSSEFSYQEWLSNSGWEKAFVNFSPAKLSIEPTNICGANCHGCPNPSLKRPRGMMLPQTFSNIFEPLKGFEDIKIEFSGIGEPLLNANLPQMVKLSEKWRSMLITSLHHLPSEDFPFECLNNLRVSVDALEQETFAMVRNGCSWNNVQETLSSLFKRKVKNPENEPEIGVSFLKHPLNDRHAQPFLNYWKRVVTPVFQQNFFKWPFDSDPEKVQWFQILGFNEKLGADFQKPELSYTPVKRRSCRYALLSMTVLWNGDVVSCPFDTEGQLKFGNVNEKNVLEIWNSSEMKKFRGQHLIQDYSQNEFCANCKDWYHPS